MNTSGLNVTLLNRRGLLATILNQMKKKQSGTIDLEMVLLAECLAAASRSSKSCIVLIVFSSYFSSIITSKRSKERNLQGAFATSCSPTPLTTLLPILKSLLLFSRLLANFREQRNAVAGSGCAGGFTTDTRTRWAIDHREGALSSCGAADCAPYSVLQDGPEGCSPKGAMSATNDYGRFGDGSAGPIEWNFRDPLQVPAPPQITNWKNFKKLYTAIEREL